MTTKKYIFIVLFILLAAAGAYAAWQFLLKEKPTEQLAQQQPVLNANFAYLTDKSVLGPVLSGNEQAVWYFDAQSGELMRRTFEGDNQVTKYPLPAHEKINFVLWPTTGSDFIIGTGQGRQLYDSAQTKFVAYPAHVKFVDWLPIGSRVVYVGVDPEGAYLAVADAQAADTKVIARLPHENFKVSSSPNGKSFVLYSNSGNDPLYFAIEGIGALEPLTANLKIEKAKFSPDGKRVAFLANEGQTKVYLRTLGTRQDPLLGPQAAGDLVWRKTNDAIVFVDPAGGLSEWSFASGLIKAGVGPTEADSLKASQMFFDAAEKYLYFVEQNTGKLGRLLYGK